MAKVQLPIGGGFYESNSLPISAQECVNWYVNTPQTQGALSDANLFGSPGVEQITTTGQIKQVNRGSHVKSGIPYFLNGETLYRTDLTFDVNGNEVFTNVF